MNFATLQGLTIPEGVVTQIADASGNVLWSAVERLTVTKTQADPSGVTSYLYYMRGNEKVILSEVGTYQVPAGTQMFAYLEASDTNVNNPSRVFWNSGGSFSSIYQVHLSHVSPMIYEFTLTKGVTFYSAYGSKQGCNIYIDEV